MQINKISSSDYRYDLLLQIPKWVSTGQGSVIYLSIDLHANKTTKKINVIRKNLTNTNGWITNKRYNVTKEIINQGEYLGTIDKYIYSNKIEYCYYYKNSSYTAKLEKFQREFKKNIETITNYDIDFLSQKDDYLNYLENRYYHQWWDWRANFNRRVGVKLLENENWFYNHRNTGYIEEDYDISDARKYLCQFFVNV